MGRLFSSETTKKSEFMKVRGLTEIIKIRLGKNLIGIEDDSDDSA